MGVKSATAYKIWQGSWYAFVIVPAACGIIYVVYPTAKGFVKKCFKIGSSNNTQTCKEDELKKDKDHDKNGGNGGGNPSSLVID